MILRSCFRNGLVLIALMLAMPAWAQEWAPYANARFGYQMDVPQDFRAQGEADNGDGQAFVSASGRQTLKVWGGAATEESFNAEARALEQLYMDDGWAITYSTSSAKWASFSGSRGGSVVYVRLVSQCEGAEYAAFELEYPKDELAGTTPTIEHMARSLQAGRCS